MAEKLTGSGVGNLRNARTDHTPNVTKAKPNAIPQADEPVIKQMEQAAQDGTTAGSMDEDTGAVPSNGALGAYRNALVPPVGWHVP